MDRPGRVGAAQVPNHPEVPGERVAENTRMDERTTWIYRQVRFTFPELSHGQETNVLKLPASLSIRPSLAKSGRLPNDKLCHKPTYSSLCPHLQLPNLVARALRLRLTLENRQSIQQRQAQVLA